jgi:hypothetical protein
MRRLLIIGVLLALLAAATPATFAKTTSCPNGTTGNGQTVSKLKARGVSCAKALRIARPAGAHSHGSGLAPSAHYKTKGFKCSGFSPASNWVWSCKKGKKKVSFDVS